MFEETIASRIRPLAEAFQATGLARMRVTEDEFELELRRSVPAPAAVAAAAPAPAAAPDVPSVKPEVIASDLVGVVRLLRPQINEGAQVESDRDLAFVEALGIRNPVRARNAGRIAAVFVTDGQPVEYGQPLFALERL